MNKFDQAILILESQAKEAYQQKKSLQGLVDIKTRAVKDALDEAPGSVRFWCASYAESLSQASIASLSASEEAYQFAISILKRLKSEEELEKKQVNQVS